ncbi:Ionotropic receptor 236, partial [Frankliniella occidentalis]
HTNPRASECPCKRKDDKRRLLCTAEALSAAVLSLLSNASAIFVAGSAPWLDVFCARIPGTATLFKDGPGAHVEWAMASTRNVVVVVAETPAALGGQLLSTPLPLIGSVLLWTVSTASSTAAALSQAARKLLQVQAHLALSLPDGAVALHAVRVLRLEALRAELEELDRWSGGRWLRGPHDLAPCDSWRPWDPSHPNPSALLLHVDNELQDSVARKFLDAAARTSRFRIVDFEKPRTDRDYAVRETLIIADIARCGLDVFTCGSSFAVAPSYQVWSYAWMLHRMYVVVPAGLGGGRRPRHVAAGVWLCTVGAVLCVAAVLAVSSRLRSGLAARCPLLQALTPLLAQGWPAPAAHRPLYGVWLLACVVLCAGLQAQMLAELSFEEPPGEINSLTELASAGLQLGMPVYDRASLSGLHHGKVFLFYHPYWYMVDLMSKHRNISLLVKQDVLPFIGTHSRDRKLLHVFEVPIIVHVTHVAFSRGSPLATPFRRTYGRLLAAGILSHWGHVQRANGSEGLQSGSCLSCATVSKSDTNLTGAVQIVLHRGEGGGGQGAPIDNNSIWHVLKSSERVDRVDLLRHSLMPGLVPD